MKITLASKSYYYLSGLLGGCLFVVMGFTGLKGIGVIDLKDMGDIDWVLFILNITIIAFGALFILINIRYLFLPSGRIVKYNGRLIVGKTEIVMDNVFSITGYSYWWFFMREIYYRPELISGYIIIKTKDGKKYKIRNIAHIERAKKDVSQAILNNTRDAKNNELMKEKGYL